MNAKLAKQLRRVARATNLSDETSYDAKVHQLMRHRMVINEDGTSQFAPYVIERMTLTVSPACQRGLYLRLKDAHGRLRAA